MFNSIRKRWAAGFLSFGGGLVLVTALLPGFGFPGMAAANTQLSIDPTAVCEVTYFALDPADSNLPNPAKEVPAAFGSAVTARGEEPVKAELNERRECGVDGQFDPALTASHYSAWSEAGLTKHKVGSTEIDAFYAKIAADPTLYGEVLSELKKLEGESVYSEAGVSAGIWSLYMVPNGAGAVNVQQGRTSADGTNAIFTHGDVVIRYRLDCGFQVNREGGSEGGFPGLPQCTPETCPPPVCPPGWYGEWPDCLEPKWVNPTTTEEGWTPRGLDNGVTDGQESVRQQQSGDTRGNAVNDQVNTSTPNTTTPDTKPSDQGGPVAPGANTGGDDQTKSVEQPNSNQNDGGTTGDTEIAVPAD